MGIVIRFDAEIKLTEEEACFALPEDRVNFAKLQQLVQDEIGHTGAIVLDVTEYEDVWP